MGQAPSDNGLAAASEDRDELIDCLIHTVEQDSRWGGTAVVPPSWRSRVVGGAFLSEEDVADLFDTSVVMVGDYQELVSLLGGETREELRVIVLAVPKLPDRPIHAFNGRRIEEVLEFYDPQLDKTPSFERFESYAVIITDRGGDRAS